MPVTAASAQTLVVDLVVRYGFQVLGALAILVVGFLVARWVGGVFDVWLQRKPVEPPARILMVRVVRIIILVFALVVAMDKFGFQIAPLVAGIGVAGIGIGLAMQGVLTNVVAGLTIIFTKPFRIGEYIELLGVHGQVDRIELFSTTLVHTDRSRVVIPNRKITGEILHNFGRIRQLHLSAGVAYASDLPATIAAVQGVLAANPRVLKEPAPVVGVSSLGDSAITVGVEPWVGVDDYIAVRGELNQALVEGLRARGIAMPFPQREVRLLGEPAR